MRIEQIEYAAAVARFGSFRRAAEELHISQPALSETVRKLEAELGVNILDRQRTGATVSAEGRELLPHLLNVIEAAQRLRFAADEQHESSRTIRLGTVSAATSPCASIDGRSNFGGIAARSLSSAPSACAILVNSAKRSSSECTGDSGELTLQIATSDQ